MTREQFGARFKAARLAAGHTQEDAAWLLEVAQPRVAEYESGKVVPPLLRLIEVVEALGLDWSILLPEATASRRPSRRS
jgi:transcriptional regulator with XRE-family HTH domain